MTDFSGPTDQQPGIAGRPVMIYGWDGATNTFRPVALNSGGQMVQVASSPSFRNIAAAATTTVKSGAGTFYGLIINKPIALSTITIYDSLTGSGTKIATITQPAALLASQIAMPFVCSFSTGLTIVTSAADDITALYL